MSQKVASTWGSETETIAFTPCLAHQNRTYRRFAVSFIGVTVSYFYFCLCYRPRDRDVKLTNFNVSSYSACSHASVQVCVRVMNASLKAVNKILGRPLPPFSTACAEKYALRNVFYNVHQLHRLFAGSIKAVKSEPTPAASPCASRATYHLRRSDLLPLWPSNGELRRR